MLPDIQSHRRRVRSLELLLGQQIQVETKPSDEAHTDEINPPYRHLENRKVSPSFLSGHLNSPTHLVNMAYPARFKPIAESFLS